MRLKYTQIAHTRETILAEQNNCCALCGEAVDGNAVLDHCHRSGLIRAVLHRGCNALLGKIENNMARNGVTHSRLEGIAHNIVNYISTEHTDLLHPTHKTAEERKKSAKRRRIKAKKIKLT